MYNIDEIKEQFSKVISYSQNIKNPKLDKLFDGWYQGKKNFIKAFGGNLWYEFPGVVTFPLTREEQLSRVRGFVNYLEDKYGHFELAEFIMDNCEGFFNNEVIKLPRMCNMPWYKEHPEDNPYKDIKLGMKLFRTFKYYESSKEVVEELQTEASRIVQESQVEGILRISVHPLDFLSSSETSYNWRSCHALDGEYRAGNLCYMQDSSTVMVYLCSEDKKKLPRFPASIPWYSKKWRMLLHYSDNWDMMFAGRQYPFFSKNMLDFVLSDLLLNTLLYDCSESETFKGKWSRWSNNYIELVEDKVADEDLELTKKYFPVNGELRSIDSIVKDGRNTKHYNDILYSTCYKAYYSKRRKFDAYSGCEYDNVFLSQLRFHIGKETHCLCCEENLILGYGQMGCPECTESEPYWNHMENYDECCICGSTINKEDCYVVNNGSAIVCHKCKNDETMYCGRCDEYFTLDMMHFNLKRNKCYCSYCNEDIGYVFDDDEKELN